LNWLFRSRALEASVEIVGSERSPLGGQVELRYVARAGLLPELSRQTYDSFYKALREAVLNGIDADASSIHLDFSRVVTHRELVVSDDGTGMSTREFCDNFMSLGGSSKFGEATRFGRIGIGSLALLQYAASATVDTKRAGSQTVTRAEIKHPWTMARHERRSQLSDLPAGTAEEYEYEGPDTDHFTRLTLHDVNDEVFGAGTDAASFYRLIDNLRRVLPLPWTDTLVTAELARVAPELAAMLEEHCQIWSCRVFAHASWERDVELTRRFYGDETSGAEEWSGQIVPLHKTLSVNVGNERRRIVVGGFLLNQKRATASWAGLTARVQNVAVEERTFFDVTSDPGFRKYITGEIWILGDINRERLINIDRSSFNRECADYGAVQRFMSRAIAEFKTHHVQRPQREKAAIRRLLEDHRALVDSTEKIVERVVQSERCFGTLPSSELRRAQSGKLQTAAEMLQRVGAEVRIAAVRSPRRYELETTASGDGVLAVIDPGMADPRVAVGKAEYRLRFVMGRESDPAVVIRNRPREIRFNCADDGGRIDLRRLPLSLALELAYLLAEDGSAETVYEVANDLIQAL
jgi:hypothetical protein